MVDRYVLGHSPGLLGFAVGVWVDAAETPIGVGHAECGPDVAEVLAGGLHGHRRAAVAEVRGECGRDTCSDVRVVVGQRETLEQFEVAVFW